MFKKYVIKFYSILFGLVSVDEHNRNNMFFELRADIVQTVKGLNHDQVLYLMKSVKEGDLDFDDIECFVLQRQAAILINHDTFLGETFGDCYDIYRLNDDYYKKRNVFIEGLLSLKGVTILLGIINKKYIDIEALHYSYVNKRVKCEREFDSLEFSHSKKLEGFFFAFPSVVVFGILLPSVSLITELDTEAINSDVGVKVTGSQWFGTYD